RFRRYGMPFAVQPRRRIAATGRACRAIVATRLIDPAREEEAFRALQVGMFTEGLLLDDDTDIARGLERVAGLNVRAVLAALDDPVVANLDPALPRRQPPDSALDVLRESPFALATAEVAAVLARGNDAPDRDAAEAQLVELAAAGEAVREAAGDGALWSAA